MRAIHVALWWVLAFSSESYAQIVGGPGEKCQACHPKIVNAFRHTGMGRSIQLMPSLPSAEFYHRLSNRHYKISNGSISRHQLNAAGEPINSIAKAATFAIGSGNHAITYVNRTAQDRLLELPVSWYAQLGGYAMSPGYDKADHLDFRREISESCLFCHSNGPKPSPIECGRCHGPEQAHLTRPAKGNILNPAGIPSERQLDICLQCHLETASQGIVDSKRRPGRSVFSFQPGARLADYKVYFDRNDSAATDRFEINHAGFRLLQSKCFLSSRGRMTCTTCHDPHSASVRVNACTQCHSKPHTSDDCARCHMPKRTASDAVHTVMTDHKIMARPHVTEPRAEVNVPYGGPLVDFYTKSDPLLRELVNLRSPDPGIYRRYLRYDPDDVPVLVALGKALLRLNRPAEAIDVLQRAVRLNPLETNALNYLAVAEGVRGNLKNSLAILQQALASNPDHTLCWINLGITHEAAGDFKSAIADYDEAIRLQPDSLDARQRRNALMNVPKR